MTSSISCGYATWLDGGTYNSVLLRTFDVAATHLNTGSAQVVGGVLPSGGQLAVSHGSGMSVGVATGYVLCPSSSGAAYGGYLFGLMAAATLTVEESDPSNPRVDMVAAYVVDEGDSSSGAYLAVLPGTPVAGATLGNLLGAPSAPANAVILAYVLVPATSTSITSSDVASVSTCTVAQGGILPITAAGAPDGYPGAYIHDLTSGSLKQNPPSGPQQAQVLPFAPQRDDRTTTINSIANGAVTILSVTIATDGNTDWEFIVKWPNLTTNAAWTAPDQPWGAEMLLQVDGEGYLYDQWAIATQSQVGFGSGGGGFTHITQSGVDRLAAGTHTVALVMLPLGDGTHDMYVNCNSSAVASLYARPVPL